MELILTVTLPLFVLVLAGYVAGRRQFIGAAGINGLTAFVFYFSLPLTLFHNMATAPVAEAFDGRFVLAYAAAGLAIYAGGVALASGLMGCRFGESAVNGFASSFGNTVFIALPIALAVFGPGAALPMALLIAVENGVLMPLTVALLELKRAGRGRLWRAPLTAGGAVLRNPVVMSVLLGGATALLGIDLPAVLDGVVDVVRGANVPCALFALGATMAGVPIAERMGETVVMTVLKLIAYPALVYALTGLVPGLDPTWRAIAVLAAAVPMGTNVYLLAARYQTYVRRASSAVLLSTMLSVLTISFLALALPDMAAGR